MRRQSFLIGLLCGLVLGAAAVIAASSASTRVHPVVVRPVQFDAQSIAPEPSPGGPPGAHRHEFNGRSIYIVPLAFRELIRLALPCVSTSEAPR